jgi:hypothetical protein
MSPEPAAVVVRSGERRSLGIAAMHNGTANENGRHAT